jgi:glycerophosphoryl diester phosphodiesterase
MTLRKKFTGGSDLNFRRKIRKVVPYLLSAVVLLLCSSCAKEPEPADAKHVLNLLSGSGVEYNENIIITAQTGCLGYGENSLLGAKAGLKTGVQAIEADISFLEDGTPVLAKSFYEADKNSVPLKVLLEEMRAYPNVRLYLYLREVSNIQGIDELVVDYGLSDRVFFIGITESIVEFLMSSGTSLPYYMLFDLDEKMPGNRKAVTKALEDISVYCPMGIVVPAEKITRELTEAAFNSYGYEVLAFDVNTSEEIANSFKCGVANIITKSPDVALESWNLLHGSRSDLSTS